jgi:hypothetical protein
LKIRPKQLLGSLLFDTVLLGTESKVIICKIIICKIIISKLIISKIIVIKVIISIVRVLAGITQYLVNPPSGQGFFDSSGRGDGVGGLERNAVAVVVAVAESRKKSFF